MNDRSHTNCATHLGWYDRGRLPHCDIDGLIQLVTFRLADSLPRSVLARWERELEDEDPSETSSIRRRLIEDYLDAGHGACHLKDPRIAEIVARAILHFDTIRYRLRAWCVMPNHVHVLFDEWTGHPLRAVVWSWKCWTTRRANTELRRHGAFWQREYHDRFIRDENHLAHAIAYIEQNPVKARLVSSPSDWPWSSASHKPPEHKR